MKWNDMSCYECTDSVGERKTDRKTLWGIDAMIAKELQWEYLLGKAMVPTKTTSTNELIQDERQTASANVLMRINKDDKHRLMYRWRGTKETDIN